VRQLSPELSPLLKLNNEDSARGSRATQVPSFAKLPEYKEVVNNGGQRENAALPPAKVRRVKHSSRKGYGGPRRTRTCNPLIISDKLSCWIV